MVRKTVDGGLPGTCHSSDLVSRLDYIRQEAIGIDHLHQSVLQWARPAQGLDLQHLGKKHKVSKSGWLCIYAAVLTMPALLVLMGLEEIIHFFLTGRVPETMGVVLHHFAVTRCSWQESIGPGYANFVRLTIECAD